MAQTAPPPSGEPIPRPLPRGGRPTRGRDTRPRFQPLDAVWMILFAALFVGVALLSPGHAALGLPQIVTATGTVVLTYLLGWRASGRAAGIAASLLLATSATFMAASAVSLLSDIFTLLSVAALFAFVAGSSLAALGLAALAVWVRPDGILLGLILMTLSLIQHRRRALLGAALFLVPALGAWVFCFVTGHFPMPLRSLGFDPVFFHWIALPAALITAWFLLPFCGEMADPIRRARWLPVVLWGALLIVLETVLRPAQPGASPALADFLPLWFACTGAGLARLLPLMTGDIPQPALRYVVATLAVLLLVGLCVRLEWPPPRPAIRSSVTAVPPPAPVPAPQHVIKPPLPVKQAVLSKPKAPPSSIAVKSKVIAASKPTKPAVRLYTVKNGKLVRRSKWAIQWDLTHPHQ